jgi:transposase
MAGYGRPKTPLVLTTEERETLERFARRLKSAQALALRFRVVLVCTEDLENKVVAARLHVNQAMVSKWRQRFFEHCIDVLANDPRPWAVRTITDEIIEAIIVKFLEELAEDATHWSTRSMAK